MELYYGKRGLEQHSGARAGTALIFRDPETHFHPFRVLTMSDQEVEDRL